MKNSILILLVTIIIVGPVTAQITINPNPYAIDHPALMWPGSARTLALGYFNIVGDGMHPDFKANPALASDFSGYYFSATTYETPYPLLSNYYGEDYYYQYLAGIRVAENISIMFSSTALKAKYSFEHKQYFDGDLIRRSRDGFDYEYRSKAYAATLAYRFTSGILLGMTGTYHERAFKSGRRGDYSLDGLSLDIGAEIRYAAIIWPGRSNNNSERFYSKWHQDRVPGINFAVALKNIGSDVVINNIHGVADSTGLITGATAGAESDTKFPLEMRFGVSWLIFHRDEFGLELFGNLMKDMTNSDVFESDSYGYAKKISHSQAIELTFINSIQLRFGNFNLAEDLRAWTWGFSVGPPFLRLEYGKIDDFEMFDDYSNLGINGRDMLTLSFNHSMR